MCPQAGKIAIMKLTDAKLRTLNTPGKHFDGSGLYLELTPAGGRYWRLKYRHGGKEKRLALGVYPDVSLKEARDRAYTARKSLQAGDDPGEVKKAERAKQAHEAANTLKAVALEWLEHQSNRWTPDTKSRIRQTLSADVFPALGARPLAAIRPAEVMQAVQKVEARGAGDQAGRVLQRVKAIYRWAVNHGRIEASPMESLMPGEILKPREVQHRAALSDRDLPEFLDKLDAYSGDPTTANALRLLILTATRPGEVRGEEQTAAEVLTAIFTGLSRVVDKLALQAILANNPEQFSLAKAAAAGVRYKDLRGLIGTDGHGAFCGADNELKILPFNLTGWQAGGIPAELTPVMTQTVVGEFSRAQAIIGPDMTILVNRLNTRGDVTISAWLSVDAVAPDAGRFWTVSDYTVA